MAPHTSWTRSYQLSICGGRCDADVSAQLEVLAHVCAVVLCYCSFLDGIDMQDDDLLFFLRVVIYEGDRAS